MVGEIMLFAFLTVAGETGGVVQPKIIFLIASVKLVRQCDRIFANDPSGFFAGKTEIPLGDPISLCVHSEIFGVGVEQTAGEKIAQSVKFVADPDPGTADAVDLLAKGGIFQGLQKLLQGFVGAHSADGVKAQAFQLQLLGKLNPAIGQFVGVDDQFHNIPPLISDCIIQKKDPFVTKKIAFYK